MNVGIPGTGVGGLFFVACALLALPVELVRAARGRSSPQRLRAALYHASLAAGMIGALVLSYELLHSLLVVTSRNAGGSAERALGASAAAVARTRDPLPALPVAPVVLTAVTLSLLLLAAVCVRLLTARSSRSRVAGTAG